MRPRSTNHPFQPKLPITKVLVPLLYRESIASPKFTEIHPAISLIAPYKVLPVSEIILKRASFSSPFQTFVGLHEPQGQILYLNIRLFVS